jgi:hypothetical protein
MILSAYNAHTAAVVRNIANPQWGNFKFNHNAQLLSDGKRVSTIGSGSAQKILPECEYHLWQIVSKKEEL